MKTRKVIHSFVVLSVLLGLVMTNTAFADNNGQNDPQNKPAKTVNNGWNNAWNSMWNNLTHRGDNKDMKKMNGISGTVSSVSGNTLTVSIVTRKDMRDSEVRSTTTRQDLGTSSRPEFNKDMRPQLATSTTVVYTVDATNAKIFSGRSTTTVSGIVAGDMVFVQGQTTAQNVVANLILVEKAKTPKQDNKDNKNVTIQGDGQPVVAGTISAISTSTLTVKNNSNVVYTVDLTNAKLFQDNKVASSSDLTVGDEVVVQGTINGTSITASTVIDQNGKGGKDAGKPESKKGFFGNLGGFFSKLFGF